MIHAQGKLTLEEPAAPRPNLDLDAIRARCSQELKGEDLYGRLKQRQLTYGPCLTSIQDMFIGDA